MATLINNATGDRVAVESGSQQAQQYFGQGYILETKAPTTTTAPATATPTAPSVPAPTATPSGGQITQAVSDVPAAPTPTTPTPTTPSTEVATQIRNVEELNKLAALGLTESDITRQGSAIFLKPGITAESLQARSAKPATTAASVTDVATQTQASPAELIDNTGAGAFENFKGIAPDRAKILEETFKSLGLTGAQDLYGQVGRSAQQVGNALEALPDTIKERTQNVGVTQNQLNRLIATESEPIAQALKDLLTSRSLLGDQLAFGFQQAEFAAQGEERQFDTYMDLLSSSGLAIDPRTGQIGESYAATQARIARQDQLDEQEIARLDAFNEAQGYVENPATGQLVPTFARTKWMAEQGIGSFDANTDITGTGQTGSFGLELMQTSGGTRSDRNNNPLNIKGSAYTAGFGGVLGLEQSPAADGGNFLVFDSPEAGFAAAQELWRNGRSYQGVNVDTALRRWSGGGYGGELATSVGIDPSRDAQSLSNEELHILQQAMAKREGFTGTTFEPLDSEDSVLNKNQFTDLYIQQVGESLSMSPDIENPQIQTEIDSLYQQYLAALDPEAVKDAVPLTTTDKQKMFQMGLDPNNLQDVNTYLDSKFTEESSSSSSTSTNQSTETNPFR